MIKVGLVSLGCPKNIIDSEIALGVLPSPPFRIVSRLDEAEVIIVNTCAFLEAARRESIGVIRRLAGYKKNHCRFLIVVGCLVQYLKKETARKLPEGDLFLGVGEYVKLPRLLDQLFSGASLPRVLCRTQPDFPFFRKFPRLLSTPGHYAYLRVADGCDNRCSYCLIPNLRGPLQSRPPARIVEEARELVSGGVRELILIAQDTSAYGFDLKRKELLVYLLEALEGIKELRWLRVLYFHPAHLNKRILQTMASSNKICPYLDIPLQHINDRILNKMGRKVTRARVETLLEQARQLLPDISLRTTMMVGFPGEGKKEFAELMDFVRRQRFDHLGVFCYSPERGTPAFRYPSAAAAKIARLRKERVMELQREISAERLRRLRGRKISVLVDGPFPEKRSKLMIAHARFQAPEIDGLVVVEGDKIKPGDILTVKVTCSSSYDLYGIVDRAYSKRS